MFKTKEKIDRLEKEVAGIKSRLTVSISEQEEFEQRFDDFITKMRHVFEE